MSKIPGLLLFNPVPVPPLPEPWLSGDPIAIWEYGQDPANAYNYEVLQQMLNHQAVEMGNKSASTKVKSYNGQVSRYWQNGGPSNVYGYTLPVALPVLEACYPPATDATVQYDPVTRTWKPSGQVLETKPWSLPPDTVLYIVEP